jgi:drug/metabolite transporter (DMT)-like permease
VTAILGGLGAALCWAVAVLCTSRAARMIGVPSVLGWVMLIGFLGLAPLAIASGVPDAEASTWTWLVAVGVANIVGLPLVYAGLRRGKVGIVAAIASTEGAVAAAIAIVAGESIGPAVGVSLAVIAGGVFLAALAPDLGPLNEDARRAAVLSAGAALVFGFGLYATGHVSSDVPAVWVALPPRLLGVGVVALPLAATGRLRLTRPAIPLVFTSGVCEVIGFLSFTVGARHGIAVTAVLAAQFAALAALGAFLVFRERLGSLQLAGVATIVVGVAFLTALRA